MVWTRKQASYVFLLLALVTCVLLHTGRLAFTGSAFLHRAKWTYAEVVWFAFNIVVYTCGMEFYARAAHRDLWHGSHLWAVHSTHHQNRKDQDIFEHNDIFGVLNVLVFAPLCCFTAMAPPSIGVCGLYGLAVGVSIYGTGYIMVHDGVHHKRFPVGGIKNVSYIKHIAAAHAKHHTLDMGPPFGMFLGPTELAHHEKGQAVPPMPKWLHVCLLTSCAGIVGGLLFGF